MYTMLALLVGGLLLFNVAHATCKPLQREDLISEFGLAFSGKTRDLAEYVRAAADASFKKITTIQSSHSSKNKDMLLAQLLSDCAFLYDVAARADVHGYPLDFSLFVSDDELTLFKDCLNPVAYEIIASKDTEKICAILTSTEFSEANPIAYKELICFIAAVYKKLALVAAEGLISLHGRTNDDASAAALATDLGMGVYQTYIASQDLPVEQLLRALCLFSKKFLHMLTQMSTESNPSSFPSWFKTLWLKLPLTVLFVILRIIRFATTYESSEQSYTSFDDGDSSDYCQSNPFASSHSFSRSMACMNGAALGNL